MDLRPHASVAAAPPLVALMGWELWAYRIELPWLAYWADTIALALAFVIGAIVGEGTRSHSVAERVLRRVEHGGLAVVAASPCLFAFSNARLESSLGSAFFEHYETGLGFGVGLVGAAGFGFVIAAALRAALIRLGRSGLALAGLTTVFAMALAAKGMVPTRLPVDALDDASTSETPPIDIYRRVQHFVLDDAKFWYVALGNTCAVGRDDFLRGVEPLRVVDGFAHCPPLDVRLTLHGTVAVFALRDGRPSLVGEVESGHFVSGPPFDPVHAAPSFHETVSVDEVPAMNAPSTPLVRSHRTDAFEVTQDGSGLDSCSVEVRTNARTLSSKQRFVGLSSDPVTVCPGVQARHVEAMDLVSVRDSYVPEVTLRGSPTDARELAGQLRAPDAYGAPPVAGFLLALGAVAVGTWGVVRRGRLQGFRTAHHDGRGTVRLDDGRRVRIETIALRPGLVAIRGIPPERPEVTYRESAGLPRAELEVLPASVASLEDRYGELSRVGGRAAISVALAGSVLALVAWFTLGHL